MQNYVGAYQGIYPGADILVIESALSDVIFQTNAAQRARLKPAAAVMAQARGRTILQRFFRMAALTVLPVWWNAAYYNGMSHQSLIAPPLEGPSLHSSSGNASFQALGRGDYKRAVEAIRHFLPPQNALFQMISPFPRALPSICLLECPPPAAH